MFKSTDKKNFVSFFINRLQETSLDVHAGKEHAVIETNKDAMKSVDSISIDYQSVEDSLETDNYKDIALEYRARLNLQTYHQDLREMHKEHLEHIEIELLRAWYDARSDLIESKENALVESVVIKAELNKQDVLQHNNTNGHANYSAERKINMVSPRAL